MKTKFSVTGKSLLMALCFLLTLIGGSPHVSLAQVLERLEIPSSLNPVGSGARALGMGGAFIAVADDATAASWNPGGLIQLETPEVSGVGAYFDRTEDNTFGTNPESSGSQNVSESRLNYLSATYPFTLWGHNMIASLNYQNLYDFTREWRIPFIQTSETSTYNNYVDYEQSGGLSAFGIAYCIQINPKLSAGFTLNFWEDGVYKNEWEQTTTNIGSGNNGGIDLAFEARSHDKYSFSGFNANFGILWSVNSKLTLGAVFKTPFTADINHKSTWNFAVRYPSNPGFEQTGSTYFDVDEELDMPMSYGIGLAYRFSDALTASIDIYRTEWGDFELTDADGNKTSPITGKPSSEADIDPTHQIRLGVEYLFIKPKYVIPLRGGLFYDPAPAEGSPDDFFGISLGSGIAKGRFVFDIAYQYRFGKDVGGSILQNLDFSQDVDEHTIYSSLIVHF